MVKRSENVNFGGSWLRSHRSLRWSEAPGPSSRVRRAASSLRMQSEETVVASYGLAKMATLTTRRSVVSSYTTQPSAHMSALFE